jgi:hypothetical protein
MWKPLILLSSLLVTACGSNGSGTQTAPSPTKRTIASGTYSATAHTSHFISFSTPASGQLSVTVSWRDASDTLWVDVSASCTSDQYIAGTCQFVYSDRTPVAIPQKAPTITSIGAGNYVLIVDNRGPADETVTYNIDVTS